MARVAVLTLALSALGCSTVLDVERMQWVFGVNESNAVPTLVEEPAVDLDGPEGMRAVSGELRAVPLKWDPVLTGAVAGYAVERALETEGEKGFERIAVAPGRFRTAFVDTGADLGRKVGAPGGTTDLGDGASYRYRVRAFDAEGRQSEEASMEVVAVTAPRPAAPEGLHAYSQLPRKIALTWEAVPDPTVVGYVLYRSPSARGPFAPLRRLEGAFETTAVDSGLGNLRVFYYRVAAMNGAGGEGHASRAARAVTKPEPLSPIRLRVIEKRLGTNVLAWEANVEKDIAGYRLMRHRDESESSEQVATLDVGVDRAEDLEVASDERVTYTLIAIDEDGLESAESDPVPATSEGYQLTAEFREGAVHLRWQDRSQEGFNAARIFRRRRIRNLEVAQVPSEGYVDTDLVPGAHYRYVVVLERPDGSQAPASTPVDVEIPE